MSKASESIQNEHESDFKWLNWQVDNWPRRSNFVKVNLGYNPNFKISGNKSCAKFWTFTRSNSLICIAL